MQRTVLCFGLGALIFFGLPGIGQAKADNLSVPQDASNLSHSYALSPGDKVKITVFNVPDMTGEFLIEPSGEIALPLLGSLQASGLTPVQLTESITEKLSKGYVNNPKVTVEVTNFRPFYVLGEVNHPGEFPYKATITIDQAIATAGGYTYRAAHHSAFLRRAGGSEQQIKFGDKPIYVLPGDTIRIGVRYF